MIQIDGSHGEGGGQIIRTALTLSLATGTPFCISNIRAGRKRPGLLKQHLTAVKAAAEIGNASTQGADLHSRSLVFEPGEVTPGDYHFSIGTAGSSTLVLQTLLPVLLKARAPSTLRLEGGTHNAYAPPFDFVDEAFLPLINRLGPTCTATLDRRGFYPAGGGKLQVTVQPSAELEPLDLIEPGPIQDVHARAIVSRLPRHVAERELKVLAKQLGLQDRQTEIVEDTTSPGPGNAVVVVIRSETTAEIVTSFGSKGVPAERVAKNAAREAQAYIDAAVPVGSHLADQLLVPLALGSGGSYVTMQPTPHTETNIETIQKFLDVPIAITHREDDSHLIEVGLSQAAD
jgi:RNA 3'-terminal phosphate cyclase (ATP)